MPNSSFLAAAVGPWPRPERGRETEKLVTVGARRAESVLPPSSKTVSSDHSS